MLWRFPLVPGGLGAAALLETKGEIFLQRAVTAGWRCVLPDGSQKIVARVSHRPFFGERVGSPFCRERRDYFWSASRFSDTEWLSLRSTLFINPVAGRFWSFYGKSIMRCDLGACPLSLQRLPSVCCTENCTQCVPSHDTYHP